MFYKFSIAQYYDRRRTKCVRLVVEPDSTPTRDTLVAPNRFVTDINKLHFARSERLISVETKRRITERTTSSFVFKTIDRSGRSEHAAEWK